MQEDQLILREYRDAYRRYAKDRIIDMDERLPRKFHFHIHRLEDVVRELQGIIPASRESQFFITLVLTGSGEKTVGHYTFPIKKYTLSVIPRRVTHSGRYWSEDCTGYLLSFDLEFFLQNVFPRHHIIHKKIFKSSVRPFLVLQEAQVKKLVAIFEYIVKEYLSTLENKNEMLAIKVLELLVVCDRFFSNAQAEGDDTIYNEVFELFNKLIEQHYAAQRSVRFYAEKLHMHPNHLNFLAKKYTGLTAKQTITGHILLEARYLLHATSLSIKEIAFQLGFASADYFSAYFGKHIHVSPAGYRLQPV